MPVVQLELEKIRIDGGTQQRAAIEQEHVDDIAEAITEGKELPPVRVYEDGANRWLSRGFHRYHAHCKAGKTKIAAELVKGTLRDAILDSVSDNIEHNALKRKNADKRNAVGKLLDDEEWREWSDRNIAERCAVSHRFVALMRKSHTGNVASQDSAKTPKSRSYTHPKTGKQATMNVSRIGKPPDDSFFDDDPPKPTKDTRPKNGHAIAVVEKSVKAEPEPPADQEGNPLKRKDLIELFARRMELSEILQTLSAIKSQVLRHVKDKDELYRYLNANTFQVAIDNVSRVVKFSLPHALCPYHPDDPLGKKNCECCDGAGWVPKDIYRQAPESLRKGLVRR